jgi:hypothetical protein
LHATNLRRLTSLLVLPIALILAACTSGSQAGGAGASGDQVAGGGSAAGDAASASIAFANLADGATVMIPFDVALDASVPLGDPSTGNHHAHIYFDTDTSAADYDIVYGTTWQVTRQLSPGQHTLTVALANPDHSLAGPTKSITIQVGDAGAGGSGGAGSSTAPTEAPPPPGY